MRNVVRSIAQAACVAIILTGSAASARAAAIASLGTGFFDVAVGYSGFSPTGITVSAGTAGLNIAGLGDVLVDSLGGGPGNVAGVALNLPTPTEAISLAFSLAGVAPDLASVLLNAAGAPITPVSDPALAALLNPSSYAFALDPNSLSGFDGAGGNGSLVYTFVAGEATVPEPGSVSLVAGAALLMASRFLRRLQPRARPRGETAPLE